MGYYIVLEASNVVIPTEKLDEAYAALVAINTPEHRGGREHFSWMPANYPSSCPDVNSILERLGFITTVAPNGVWIDGYDSKSGDEDIFLQALAPYVIGFGGMPFINWTGSDGQAWRNEFEDGKMWTRGEIKTWGPRN